MNTSGPLEKAKDEILFSRAAESLCSTYPDKQGNLHRQKQYHIRRRFFEKHGELPAGFNFKV